MIDDHTKKIIEGAINKDTVAFEQLIAAWHKTIFYRCIRLTNVQDAEDVAQEALLNIFKSISTLEDPERFESWLYTVVNRTCAQAVKNLKKDRSQTILVSPEEYEELADNSGEMSEFLPHEYVENKEQRGLLMGVIDELTPEYREVLLLFYYDQMSYREIGKIMEKSEQQVTNLLFRARASIKKKLEKAGNTQFAFAALPLGKIAVLTQVFRMDADSLVTEQMCKNLTAGLHESISSGYMTAGSANAASAAKSVTIKSFAGIVAISGLIAAGIMVTNNQREAPAIDNQPAAMPAAESPVVFGEETPAEPAFETAIITMTDMIGGASEAMLLVFEGGEVDEASWQAFLDDIGAKMEEAAYAPDGMQYKIYILQKQDKQLALFERKDTAGEKLDIWHQFGDRTEGIPYMTDVILLFGSR